MKLIFAQGNPGKQYEKTRHNVGFLALDYYAHNHGASFQSKMKFNADVAEMSLAGEKILLVKPMTFYNETGVSARSIIDFYKLSSADMLVLHDELALPFGKIRVRHDGSDAGNNGIKSLTAHLTSQFARVRIGIHNTLVPQMQSADFVLSTLTPPEITALNKYIFPAVTSITDQFITGTLDDDSITAIPTEVQ